MHIHTDAFRTLRQEIAAAWPQHRIAFDVVFEAPPNTRVDWHCDYESLGPFEYEPRSSIDGHHFVSVHFNLTPRGGSLHTLDWPRLSFVHHLVIVSFGIYSAPHACLNWLSRPVCERFSTRHPNDVGIGNAFDNMRLHAVSPGEARISYVVRLVKKDGCVWMSPSSVRACAKRSSACERLTSLITPHIDDRVDAASFAWSALGRETEKPAKTASAS